jgi:uncharacterized RDD family membrane protein YckC
MNSSQQENAGSPTEGQPARSPSSAAPPTASPEQSGHSGQSQSWGPPPAGAEPTQPTWAPPAAPVEGHGPYAQQQGAYPPQPGPYSPQPPAAHQPAYPQQYSPVPQTQPAQSTYPHQPAPGAPAIWVPPVPVYPYTPWIRRVGAYLIDFAPIFLASIPFWVGYVLFYVQLIQLSSTPSTVPPEAVLEELLRPALVWLIVGFVLMLGAIAWQWYNRWLTAGRTGQSMGKRVLNMKLVAEINGQPIGPVNAFLRDLLHVVDGALYIGYLWPLWDAKRQTFADMIMKTVVIDQPPALTADPAVAIPGANPYGSA